jgi:hypothetical protein
MPVRPSRWSLALPAGTTARHARGPRVRRPVPRARVRARRRTGTGALAVAVTVVGLTAGLGAGAAVDRMDGRGSGTVQAAGDAGVDAAAERGAVAGGAGDRAAQPSVPAGAGATAVGRSADAAGAGVGAAADLADRVEAVADGVAGGVAGDVRPLPLPTLVPRDTVGPVWLSEVERADGLLSVEVPESASGVLDVVPGSAPAPGAGPVRSVRVEVEQGLPVDGPVFAAAVMATLNDPRGWGAGGAMTFARTDGPADLRVVLASPATVDAMCAPLPTAGEVSCGTNGHAALNFRRWVEATGEFADRHLYRQYLVNHEVGHLLGHSHERCPGAGQPAPIMQQQSYLVAPCTPNGWPSP